MTTGLARTRGLSRTTLTDRAAQAILELIVDEDLGVGDPLPTSGELARRFDVSVVVVREATATLAGRGILNRRQGREAVVARPGADILDSILRIRMRQDGITLEEFQQCRAALEAQSAVLAAGSGTSAERRAALEEPLRGMREARSVNEVRDADFAFHIALARLAGNHALLLLLEALNTVVNDSLGELYRRLAKRHHHHAIERAVRTHTGIFEAVVAGDAAAAVRAMATHFTESAPAVDYGILREELLPPSP